METQAPQSVKPPEGNSATTDKGPDTSSNTFNLKKFGNALKTRLPNLSSLINRVRGRETPQPENTSTPVQDIESGMREILNTKFIKDIKGGNAAAVFSDAKQLLQAVQGISRYDAYAEGASQETAVRLRNDVINAFRENAQEGLNALFSRTEWEVANGMQRGITQEPQELAAFFAIAEQLNCPLEYPPSQNNAEVSVTDLPSAPLAESRKAAEAHLRELIQDNLEKGLSGKFSTLGFQVGRGFLEDRPKLEADIEAWIGIMGDNGWTILPENSNAHVTAEGSSNEKVIDRANINRLVHQAIRENLPRGMQYISQTVEGNVRLGRHDPLIVLNTSASDLANLYVQTWDELGSNNNDSASGEGASPVHFDPEELANTVKANLPAGLQAIENNHLTDVRQGNADSIAYSRDRLLPEYIHLAQEYGVTVDAEALNAEMYSHITAENLQAGVNFLRQRAEEETKHPTPGGLRKISDAAHAFQNFVRLSSLFGDQVNFDELRIYLGDISAHAPPL